MVGSGSGIGVGVGSVGTGDYVRISGGSGTDPDQRRSQAGFWFGMANRAKRSLPLLTNVRLVE